MRLRPIEPLDFSVLATLFLVIFVFQIITLTYMTNIYPATRQADHLKIITDIAHIYEISRSGLVVRADQCSPAELKKYSPLLSREISRYAHSIIEQIRLRRIVLCSGLTVNGKKQSGFAVTAEGTILLDISPSGPEEEAFFRRIIHHELFHIMDPILEPTGGADGRWARLNPKGFRYGGDAILEALEITNESPDRRADTPGFLNHYSMVSAQEDRAELFSTLMVSPDDLRTIALEDEIIKAKVVYLKHELLEFSREFDSILGDPARGHE